jgi:hypothetical protein
MFGILLRIYYDVKGSVSQSNTPLALTVLIYFYLTFMISRSYTRPV